MKEKTLLKNKIETYLIVPMICLIILVLVNVGVYFISKNAGLIMTLGILLYFFVMLFIYVRYRKEIQADLIKFSIGHERMQKELLNELSIPYVLVTEDGRITWSNQLFKEILNQEPTGKKKKFLAQVFPELTKDVLPEEGIKEIELTHGEKHFRVEIKRAEFSSVDEKKQETDKKNKNTGKDSSEEKFIDSIKTNVVYAVYFYDETELKQYIKENRDQKLVCGLIYIDNYYEVMERIEDVRQSLLLALIDRKINKYMSSVEAVIKKFEKDKYVVCFQKKYLDQLEDTKFSILDEVRTINVGNELDITLSIGIGEGTDHFQEAYEYARTAMDLALGRGGDQAVVKEGEKITYYGGKTQGVEKSTRVKARVKAHALRELLETKDNVIIMGHRIPDVDCLGSGLGIYRLVTDMGKKAHIVVNEATVSVRPIMKNFIGNSQYGDDLFYNSEEALAAVDANTLLVIVDVNRPSYTECPELIEKVSSVVVLDHHRQTNETVEHATLSYIEPYASSACEMVAEILQYVANSPRLRPIEADAMYAGMLVDTDNFVTKTGVRTFEAAAYLRKSGADVVRVRKLFRSDIESYQARAEGVKNAELYLDDFAVSVMESQGVDSPTVVAAKVANELLNIDGIKASFVLTKVDDTVYISARSIDEVNVQVIMEKLDGGGHASVAGAQLKDISLEDATTLVKNTLRKLRDEGEL